MISPKIYDFIETSGLFIVRLILAVVFVPAGWGKLQNLEQPISFFDSLGIPLPFIMAPMVGFLELACGVMLLFGVFTRLAALPLIPIMAVAILTAKMDEIIKLKDLTDTTEFLYLAMALMLVAFGPGKLSFDMLRISFRKGYSPANHPV